jgi:hypothetical protein
MTNDLRRGHVRSQAHWLAKSSSILRKSSRLSNPCFLLTLKVINVLRMYGSSVRRYLFSSRLVDFLRFSQSLWSLRKVPTYNHRTMACEVASNLIFLVYNVILRKHDCCAWMTLIRIFSYMCLESVLYDDGRSVFTRKMFVHNNFQLSVLFSTFINAVLVLPAPSLSQLKPDLTILADNNLNSEFRP